MAALSKTLKNTLARKLAGHAFDEKIKAAESAMCAAGYDLYVHVFGAENVTMMEKLPDGFFEKGWCFYINVRGYRRTVRMAKSRNIPYRAAGSCRDIPVVDFDDEPLKKYFAAFDAHENLERAKNAAAQKAEAAMANINTFGQLWKLWPESQSVIGHFEKKPERALLPAVVITDLNKELGLPAGGAA